MVRTTDSPWNNTPQKPHTFEDLQLMVCKSRGGWRRFRDV